ncbi:hypothetical protein [Zavarzinia aquatilis]|uniref:Uncharacterized protein n=1 Tax=Zavarzinia aquatilis TaxID=2211142 RepID=A0A317EH59_9PROT|nr:hypothetical protein [Zavarzinia aquatilis]PWR24545.1 hypothetical protein DKG74_06995 [Zavarzinia aquatilis]
MDNPPSRAIRVSGAALAAASLFSSREATRYYLNGVGIEPCPDGGALVVATDGATMTVIRDLAGYANAPANCSLPPAAIKACALRRRDGKSPTAYFFGNNLHVIAEDPGTDPGLPVHEDEIRAPREDTVFFGWAPAIDGPFPDWRRVVKHVSGGHPRLPPFNPALMARFGKADQLLGVPDRGPLRLSPSSEEGPIVVSPESNAWFGLIMPMQAKGTTVVPAWAGLAETAATDSAA